MTVGDISGVSIHGPSLRPVLKHWIEMMIDPSWGKDDAPWWYNERASISQFAGAIWLKNGWVFEEYSARKKSKRAKDKPGRVDLMFTWGKAVQAVAEAKQIWPSLNTRNGFKRKIDEALKAAAKDAARVREVPETFKRLSIVFISPIASYRLVESDDRYHSALTSMIRELKSMPNTSVAWAFPVDRRRLYSKKQKYYYPGTAIVIREIK
jgi:hypothetical protein